METPSVEDFLGGAALVVSRETFGEGETAFEVDIRFVDRKELEAAAEECMTVIKNRTGVTREPDTAKLRKYIRNRLLVGWQDLTYAKLALLCNRAVPSNGIASTAVPFNADNALRVLEHARGKVGGEVTNFEDWVWTRSSGLAMERAQAEAAEKNG